MYLEILPHRAIAPIRLLVFIKGRYLGGKKINIVLPIEFKEEVDSILDKLGEWKKKVILSERTLIHHNCFYIYYQFDYLRNISYNQNYSYITSLRYPRTSKHIKNWIDGRRQDNLLSLIAINNNQLTAFSPQTKQWMNVPDRRGTAAPVGYSGYQWKDSPKKKIIFDELAKTLYHDMENHDLDSE